MIRHEASKVTKDTKKKGLLVSHEVLGAAIEVHRHLGPGLLESIYEAALCRELWLRHIGVERQVPIRIEYKGLRLRTAVRLDLLVEDSVVVEVKAVEHLAPVHRAQLLTYLKVTGHHVGLLINFNVHLLRSGMRRMLLG
jgi:GxxExxY protein